jgi:hypothetical protein
VPHQRGCESSFVDPVQDEFHGFVAVHTHLIGHGMGQCPSPRNEDDTSRTTLSDLRFPRSLPPPRPPLAVGTIFPDLWICLFRSHTFRNSVHKCGKKYDVRSRTLSVNWPGSPGSLRSRTNLRYCPRRQDEIRRGTEMRGIEGSRCELARFA